MPYFHTDVYTRAYTLYCLEEPRVAACETFGGLGCVLS